MEKKNSSTVLIFIFGHSEPTESLSLGKVISICTRHKTNTSSLPDKEQTFLADYLSATPAQGDCLQVADPRPRDGGCEAGVMCDVEISGVTWRDILLITSCFYCLQRHLCRKARLCPQRDQKMRKCVFGPAAGLWLVKLLILANHRPAAGPNTHLRTFLSRCGIYKLYELLGASHKLCEPWTKLLCISEHNYTLFSSPIKFPWFKIYLQSFQNYFHL